MEFSDLIKVSNLPSVILNRSFFPPCEMTLVITGHHIILSSRLPNIVEDLWILHKSVDSIERKSSSGLLNIKCKNLQVISLIICNGEDFMNVAESLEKLAAIDDITRAYPFYYHPTFKFIEDGWNLFLPEEEFSKVLYSSDSEWRLSYVNADFSVCSSYPKFALVPFGISDDVLRGSAKHRQHGRFPTLSYRHTNGAVIVRCSQPLSGPYSKRNKDDELLLQGILGKSHQGFIVDTRSFSAASAAKSKGGGFESESYYTSWKRIHKSIGRYNYLLDSYSKCIEATSETASVKWLSKLVLSGWMTHVKDILNTACLIAQCVEQEEVPVIVHGYEGMDLTLCTTSLSQIILCPDSRTLRGFEALIVREWLQGGHPFWSRTSKGPLNDSQATKCKVEAPTFILFLDAVWQIYNQFPCSFEFTDKFLIVLSENAYFSNFGSFLADSEAERSTLDLKTKTVSLWSHLNRPEIMESYLNPMYEPNNKIIWPSVAPISLNFWSGNYLRWTINPSSKQAANDKIQEIIQRNKEAKIRAIHLKRELTELMKEAEQMGLVERKNCPSS